MHTALQVSIIGEEPSLAGQRCTGFMLQHFHDELRIVNLVNVAFLRFGEQWYRLWFEGFTVFWRAEAPLPVPNSGLEFGHLLNDLSDMVSVVGQTVESVGYWASERGDVRTVIAFGSGKRLEFLYSYETDSTSLIG